jgi:hypothetical protein
VTFKASTGLEYLDFSAQLLGLQAVEHDEHELTRWVLFSITFLSTGSSERERGQRVKCKQKDAFWTKGLIFRDGVPY